ncbi:MAG: hypothetical protein K0U74_01600 [Alphaproteobacteria bacterium]|nr:hypothetical protein [Alphaproteobacteria bacterium]
MPKIDSSGIPEQIPDMLEAMSSVELIAVLAGKSGTNISSARLFAADWLRSVE